MSRCSVVDCMLFRNTHHLRAGNRCCRLRRCRGWTWGCLGFPFPDRAGLKTGDILAATTICRAIVFWVCFCDTHQVRTVCITATLVCFWVVHNMVVFETLKLRTCLGDGVGDFASTFLRRWELNLMTSSCTKNCV